MLVVIAKEINESKTEVKLHTAPCTRSCIGIVVFYFGRLYLPFSLEAGILGQHAKYLQVVRVSEEKKSVQNTFLHQFLDRGLLNFLREYSFEFSNLSPQFKITYINCFKVQCHKMSLGSSDIPCTIFKWVIRFWIIRRSQFHIDKIHPVLTWIMIDIFYPTNPTWSFFAKMIIKRVKT